MALGLPRKLTREKEKSLQENLFDFAQWDLKTIKKLQELLLDYETTPRSKAITQSMIKFEDMYKPLRSGPYSVDAFGILKGKNEERLGRRMRAYLYKKDLIKSVDGTGGKRLILTTRAHKIFYQEYPLARLRKEKWDGTWSIVVYDFPEELRSTRNYLRQKLKNLGFGIPQESIMVSPLPLSEPIKDLIDGERIEKYAWVLTAKRVLGIDNVDVAGQAWSLPLFNDLYAKLVEILPKIKQSKKRGLLDQWKKYFLAVDSADPYLPFELLPEDWQGERCKNEFAKLGLTSLMKSIFSIL